MKYASLDCFCYHLEGVSIATMIRISSRLEDFSYAEFKIKRPRFEFRYTVKSNSIVQNSCLFCNIT